MTTPKIDWTRTAPAPLDAWRKSLKVGDKVGVADLLGVSAGDADVAVEVKTVVKITPSGQVCTEAGSGQRFAAPSWRGQGRHAMLSIFPLVEEEAPEAEAAPASPREGTITVVPSPIRVTELEDGRLVCQTPYYEPFVAWCKVQSGKKLARYGDYGDAKAWTFDASVKEELTRRLVEIWGVDGTAAEVRAVDVLVDLDVIPTSLEIKSWWFLGREVAWRKAYDWAVKTDGVKVIKGAWAHTGGTRTQPRVTAEKGTVIEVRGVPLALALREGDARDWQGISLVKRAEGEAVSGPVSAAPQKPLVKVAADLATLVRPDGKPVEIEVLATREREIKEIDAIAEAMISLVAHAERRGLETLTEDQRAEWARGIALAEGLDTLEEVLKGADYAYWRCRLDRKLGDRSLRKSVTLWVAEVVKGDPAPAGADRDLLLPVIAAILAPTMPAAPAPAVEEAPVLEEAPAAPAPALGEQLVELDTLALDPRTQLRAERSAQTVEDYAERMAADADGWAVDPDGRRWPAVIVYRDQDGAWVADGHHRVEAARAAGLTTIQADVRAGGLRDAVLYAASANTLHGLRPSRADKRRAIRALLEDEEWRTWSDREIAKRTGASHTTVSTVRAELEAAGAIAAAPVRQTSQGLVDVEQLKERQAEGRASSLQLGAPPAVEPDGGKFATPTPAPDIEEQLDALLAPQPVELTRAARTLYAAPRAFAALDPSPVGAEDVRDLRAYLGLSQEAFAARLGTSRQRVAEWEEVGSGRSHGAVNALMRLFLAGLPQHPDAEPVEEVEALRQAVIELDQARAEELAEERASANLSANLPAEVGFAESEQERGVDGFGWRREGGVLIYRTPYQADIAKALQTTSGAVWDKDAKRWTLPDTEESVELLQTLVRRHWGVELGPDLIRHEIDNVGKGAQRTPGELLQLAKPSAAHPDGLWGRVLSSYTWHEWDDGWYDQHNMVLFLERATAQDDPDVAAAVAAHQEDQDAKNKAYSDWQIRQRADLAQAEGIKDRWEQAGLVKIELGDGLIEGVVAEWRKIHRCALSYDGRLYADLSEATVTHGGRTWVLGHEWAHVAFDDDRATVWAPRELLRSSSAVKTPSQATLDPKKIMVWEGGRWDTLTPSYDDGQTLLTQVAEEATRTTWWVAVTVTGRNKTARWVSAEDASSLGGPMDGGYRRTLHVRPATPDEIAALPDAQRAKVGTVAYTW